MAERDDSIALVDYLYELPGDLVAQASAIPRDSSRLMRLARQGGARSHHRFTDLPKLLHRGDLLIANETKVFPARLRLRKLSGGRVELVLLKPVEGNIRDARIWEAMGRPGSALMPGRELLAGDGTLLRVVSRVGRHVTIEGQEPLLRLAERLGEVPLPPYIERPDGPEASDTVSYQSIFARELGSAAAPTASLHFTPRVVRALEEAGVQHQALVLHVGLGTFAPLDVRYADDLRQQKLHTETYAIPEATLTAIEETHNAGCRVIAVGTTVARALESYGMSGRPCGETDLFIYPGHRFRVVDGLLTNFHLPGSSLMLLVAAFAGRDSILDAYKMAIQERYRFFSYGDAMAIL